MMSPFDLRLRGNDVRGNDTDILPLTKAITRLAIAPTAGLAVLMCWYWPRLGRDVFIFGLYVAPFCYGAAGVFVLPLFAVWPRLRRPSYHVAAVWGVLASWCASMLLFALATRLEVWTVRLGLLFQFGVAGASSGLLYASLALRRSTK